MNTGIGDAMNLAWKLAAVVQGRTHESLLDSNEPERIAFARRLVATTDRAFTAVTSPGAIARRVRLDIVPLLIPRLFELTTVRRLLFRTVSRTAANYRGSSLSEGHAATIHGGDRLPWVKTGLSGAGEDNFTPLTSLEWQRHLYGKPAPAIREVSDARQLPLHVFPWRPEMGRTGLRRNAVYLVRPDASVPRRILRAAAAVTAYLDTRKLTPKR